MAQTIGRDRIAGQAEHLHRAEPADASAACPAASRSSRTKLHAFGGQRRAAPGRDRRPRRRPVVTRTSRLRSRAGGSAAIVASTLVRDDAEIDAPRRLRPRHQRDQREAVGSDDLAGPGVLARAHQFVAGGEDRDARPAMRPARPDGSSRRPARVARRQAPACAAAARRPSRNRGPPARICLPGGGGRRRPITRRRRASASSWMTMVSAPAGTGAAGEDAHRLARADRAGERRGRRRPRRSRVRVVGTRCDVVARAPRSRPWPRHRERRLGARAREVARPARGHALAASGSRSRRRAARPAVEHARSASATGSSAAPLITSAR